MVFKKFKKFGTSAAGLGIQSSVLAGIGKAGGTNAQKVTGPALQGISSVAGFYRPIGSLIGAKVVFDNLPKGKKKK